MRNEYLLLTIKISFLPFPRASVIGIVKRGVMDSDGKQLHFTFMNIS